MHASDATDCTAATATDEALAVVARACPICRLEPACPSPP